MNQSDFTQMIRQARNKPIPDYLDKIGFKPAWVSLNNLWYVSPIRPDEKTPSFKVNTDINKWYDFGNRAKGDIIDLVMKLENKNTIEAVKSLQNFNPAKSLSFGGLVSNPSANDSAIEIIKVQPLKNQALIQYMESRLIPYSLGSAYLKEIYYRINGKHYFSLAFHNNKQGYALRNKYFKNAISPAGITTFKGQNESLNLFEGFFDFLSALVYYKVKDFDNTVIVLNSLTFLDHVLPLLSNYSNINLFFDNDQPGNEAAIKIKQLHDQVTDWSKITYPNCKDFNQFIISL